MTVVGVVLGLVFALAFLIIKRKVQSPEKSILACALNVFLTPMRMLKIGPYKGGEKMLRKLDASIQYATKKAKLEDFGGTEFINNYNVILNTDTHKREHFTNLGYISAKVEVGMTWVRRLKIIDYLKQVPEIKQVPTRSPVFVMGLPRTGTTFLHRLLSLDPAVRSPLTWELLAPVPSVGAKASTSEHQADRAKREKFIKNLIKSRDSMGDSALKHIHEIGHDLPEECLLGLSDELPVHLSLVHASYMNLDIFFKMDAYKAYAHYKNILQMLSYQVDERSSARRWVLKCPIHLFYTKEIAQNFPDAKLVWTHRHPASAVPSLCSLVEAFHKVYYEPGEMDPNFGRKMSKLTEDVLVKAGQDIETTHLQCSHVSYARLIADPIGTVRTIYEQFGWEMSPEYVNNINSYLEEDKKKRSKLATKEKLHHYTAQQYGLTTDELSQGKYAEYIKQYNIPFDDK